MRYERIYITRDDLYKRVWSEPIMKIADEYGLSGRGLAKICSRLEIPVPGRGYWRQKGTGKKVYTPRLPIQLKSRDKGVHITIQQRLQVDDFQPSSELHQLIHYEKSDKGKITVNAKLTSPHPLIKASIEHLRHIEPDDIGRLRVQRQDLLDVTISKDSIARAMRIMDALVKALEKRGFSISNMENIGGNCNSKKYLSCAIIMGEKICFHLTEKYSKKERPLTKEQLIEKINRPSFFNQPFDYFPTGKLYLEITTHAYSINRKTWSDTNTHRLEDLMNDFMMGLIKTAAAITADRIEREKEEQLHRERIKQEQERERIRQQEMQRVKALDRDVSFWYKSQQTHSYLEAVKVSVIKKDGKIVPGSEMDKWLTWAFQQADSMDPLREFETSSNWLENR